MYPVRVKTRGILLHQGRTAHCAADPCWPLLSVTTRLSSPSQGAAGPVPPASISPSGMRGTVLVGLLCEHTHSLMCMCTHIYIYTLTTHTCAFSCAHPSSHAQSLIHTSTRTYTHSYPHAHACIHSQHTHAHSYILPSHTHTRTVTPSHSRLLRVSTRG